jgi:hypothetical protein
MPSNHLINHLYREKELCSILGVTRTTSYAKGTDS